MAGLVDLCGDLYFCDIIRSFCNNLSIKNRKHYTGANMNQSFSASPLSQVSQGLQVSQAPLSPLLQSQTPESKNPKSTFLDSAFLDSMDSMRLDSGRLDSSALSPLLHADTLPRAPRANAQAKIDFATARELLFLAPLAGYTDLPFRSVVKRFGVDVTVSEMISSHALAFASAKTLKMAEKSPLETPYSVQIAGSKPEVIKRAIEILNQKEGIDILDFNCGCPAPKVANHGNGSGLLQNLSHLVAMLKLIRETSTTRHTSVKVRLGFDKKIPLEIAHALNDAPVDFVVVHGRTRSDGYKKERIDYDAIAAMRQTLRHPVIANGEIDSARKAHEVMERTGANGVMIGRAALSAPWIFWQIRHRSDELPNLIKKELVLEHFDAMVGFYGERGVVMFRKNLHAYAKGHEGASAFRNVVNTITSPKEMRERIEACFVDSFVAWASESIVGLNKKSV